MNARTYRAEIMKTAGQGRCYSSKRRKCKLLLAVTASTFLLLLNSFWNIAVDRPLNSFKVEVNLAELLMESASDVPKTRWKVGCDDCEFLAASHPTVYARTGLSCRSMFESDNAEIQRAKDYIKDHPRTRLDDEQLVELTRDCSTFRRSRGYFEEPLSDEEADFPIAFSILAFKDVDLVERLLRAIYIPEVRYFRGSGPSTCLR